MSGSGWRGGAIGRGLQRAAAAIAAGVLALGWAAAGPGPALAQDFLTALPAAARARLAEPEAIAGAFAAAPGRSVRVIVEFAAPSLPAGVRAGSAEADGLQAARVRATQDAILERAGLTFPDARGEAPARLNLRRMTASPMLALDASPEVLARLAGDPQVVRIHLDRLSRPLLTGSLPQIGMPAAYAAGATGQGQVVAVLDTGARLSHEFLASRIVAGACFNTVAGGSISRCPGGATSATTLTSGNDCTSASVLGCGHGTHVAGIAAGFVATPASGNPAHGVAREARILTINVFAQFPESACGGLPAGVTHCLMSYDSDQIAALDHVYNLRNTYAIAAVNMSLGGDRFEADCTINPLRPAVQRLRNVGIAVIAAAGNDGWNSAVSAPGCIPEVITVGSVNGSDLRSNFSNWGSLVELAAPGEAIRSSYVSGTSNTHYAFLSGTSMATPHVAGAFAALRSLAPNATIDELLAALRETGTPVSAAGATVPRINVGAAAQRFVTGAATTTTLTGPGSADLGAPVDFSAQVTSNAGTPPGTVSFRRGGTEFATAALDATGRAQVSTSALPAGTHQITAHYLGAPGFRPSQSAALSITINPPGTPPNDAFAMSTVIAAPGTFVGTNVNATREPNEPAHGGSTAHGASVWWRYTPAASGTLTIDTCGSTFDTVLAVYTGTALSNLVEAASNDDSCGLQSRVQFPATAGTTYHIAVAGDYGATGSITLTLALQVVTQTTTTALTGPASGQTGQTLSYTATVTAAQGTPTGTVSFRRNGVEFATGTLNNAGQATGAGSFPEGTHTITAHYLGATGYAASASAGLTVTVTSPTVDGVEFAGGGSVFAFTDACAAAGWPAQAQAVQLRYGPGEVNGMPTQTAILWPTGAEHIQVWEPFAPTTQVFGGLGRQMWTFFVVPPDRPRVRPVQRRILRPAGETNIARADEIMLRLRVENWSGVRGCSATVAGVLRRIE